MAETPPAPTPTTGRGATGRLASLPPAVKYGGAALLAATAFILYRRYRTNKAAAASNAGPTTSIGGQDYGFAPGGLSPPLMGYNPTGQITGYDVNGNPVYGVTPPSAPGNSGTQPPVWQPPGVGGHTEIPAGGPPLPVPTLPPAPVQGLPGIPVFQAPGNYVPGSPFFTPSGGRSPSGAAAPTKGSNGQTIGTYTWVSPGGPGMDPAGTLEYTGYPPPPGV